MNVLTAVETELKALSPAAFNSVEGQIAINLAAIMDSGAGIANGGVSSTAKALASIMADIRDKYKVRGAGRLEVIRGGLAK